MSIKSKNTSTCTELVHIGGVGFMFEVNPNLKHNLISPDVLVFFEDVPKSGEVTKDCAFPPAVPFTNLRQSLFQHIGYDWAVCTDGVFRKNKKIKCDIELNGVAKSVEFNIDNSLMNKNIAGIIAQHQS